MKYCLIKSQLIPPRQPAGFFMIVKSYSRPPSSISPLPSCPAGPPRPDLPPGRVILYPRSSDV